VKNKPDSLFSHARFVSVHTWHKLVMCKKMHRKGVFMTDLQLLNDIVESLREFVKSDAITMKLGNEYKDLKVYPQDLPEKYDEDDEELRNYVVIMIADEDVVDDEWRVEVHFSINIEDMDNDHSGWVNVMYLMNEIYRHFIKVGIVGRHTRMERKAHKRFNPNVLYPYFESDLITYWTLPTPCEEFDEMEVSI